MKKLSEIEEEKCGILVGVIILWFLSVALQGQEIENLGIVTARRGLILERQNTNRADFVHFVLEFKGANFNDTILIKTNDFLSLKDLGMIPDGHMVMGQTEVYSDGDESPVALFRVEVRRTKLLKSKARGITIAGTNHAGLHEILQERRAGITNAVGAPMPGGSSGSGHSTQYGDFPNMGMPMRGGSNESYSEHMAKYFSRPNRK
jgi:hypothetical protein